MSNGVKSDVNNNKNDGRDLLAKHEYMTSWLEENHWARNTRNGYIGPGTSCFLMTLKENNGPSYNGSEIVTSICNITHTPSATDV
jgi:hypothetical protein